MNKLIHRRCIDTSVLYHAKRGPPYKPGLRYLASTYLKREIQESKSGHDSTEDALVSPQVSFCNCNYFKHHIK